MAGYLNRSHLLSPVESKSLSLDDKSDSFLATRTEMTTSVCWLPDVGDSPLKIFVLAKKKINDVFVGIQSYVEESNKFLSSIKVESNIVSEQLVKETSNFRERITGIRDVLTRDHMKVVFFGRTSNGKSTVINALLQDKILPSGLGHTTNCFLQVEGGDTPEPYLLTEDSNDPQNVQSVAQLAHALNSEKLGDSSLVRILWPKEKYPLLRDDVVLVDSPGIDVSPNLDEWIDKHCLNADVFVLVANAESTLMLTEKNFFHKVSERLSKPNIFILNNRWDASAFEPEFLERVRKQHLDRTIAFLVDELHVCTRLEVEDRVFFVSAREMLQARLKIKQGLAPHTGALADGFQNRYFEFQDFERKFEECLSKSAVKTKFEQHTQQGKAIIKALQHIMELTFENSHKKKKEKMELRKEHKERLEFTQQQLRLLTDEVKHHIGHLVHKVEQQVAKALNEEIHRLNVLVNEFERPFHPDNLVLSVYKKELHTHVEEGLGSNLRSRLSNTVAMNVESSQKEMIARMSSLLPQEHRQQMTNIMPRHNFEVLYRINCDSLCSDFQEDLEFQFSLGLVSLMKRFLGPRNTKRAKETIPRPIGIAHQSPNAEVKQFFQPSSDYLSIVQQIALVSPTSQTAVGTLAVGGFLVRTVGWKVIILTAGIYGLLYAYEWLTWTNKAKERAFKKQYVNHTTRKLKLIVDLTSANCSHQVQQELSSTFARLCQLIDEVVSEMQGVIRRLDTEVENLDECLAMSRILRNKAGYLMSELETFSQQYLQYDQ
ncbi:mitofusin-2-like [Limulus polyphemus]|uniref:Mitofusin-2-like n=1 Tax=Limulus polyphemus TaxID=6850 RepID=A0ABM1S4S2_LIMPO|nr:mitofusin-2-like [Limulus polyphemus]XP_022238627.1 mitofusin-2-like [Limulus polyphemus]